MEKIKKISIARLFLQWLLALSVMTGLSVPVGGAEVGPRAMLQGMTQQLIEIARTHPEILDDPVKLRAVANEVVLPHVDFIVLSRRVLGKYWRRANAARSLPPQQVLTGRS